MLEHVFCAAVVLAVRVGQRHDPAPRRPTDEWMRRFHGKMTAAAMQQRTITVKEYAVSVLNCDYICRYLFYRPCTDFCHVTASELSYCCRLFNPLTPSGAAWVQL